MHCPPLTENQARQRRFDRAQDNACVRGVLRLHCPERTIELGVNGLTAARLATALSTGERAWSVRVDDTAQFDAATGWVSVRTDRLVAWQWQPTHADSAMSHEALLQAAVDHAYPQLSERLRELRSDPDVDLAQVITGLFADSDTDSRAGGGDATAESGEGDGDANNRRAAR